MTTTRLPALTVAQMTDAHARAVLAIYRAGIDTGDATFETDVPDWTRFCVGKLLRHRFVALDADRAVLGWIAASATSKRPAYAGVVEHSVYVRPDAAGQGVGRALLDAFVASTEAAGIWTISTSIFPENTASLALHAKAGFRTVGTRERVARLHGVWRDTVLLERRSPLVD